MLRDGSFAPCAGDGDCSLRSHIASAASIDDTPHAPVTCRAADRTASRPDPSWRPRLARRAFLSRLDRGRGELRLAVIEVEEGPTARCRTPTSEPFEALYDKRNRLTLPALAIGALILCCPGWASLQIGWR